MRAQQCREQLDKIDLLVVPTSAYNYTVAEIQARRLACTPASGPPRPLPAHVPCLQTPRLPAHGAPCRACLLPMPCSFAKQAEEEVPAYKDVTFSKNANLGRRALAFALLAWRSRRSPAIGRCACVRHGWHGVEPHEIKLGSTDSPMASLPSRCRRWTNFVNLQDMCGVSVFSGLLRPGAAGSGGGEEAARREHLAATGNPSPVVPFGITLLAPSWMDEYVAGVAAAYQAATGLKAGPLGHSVTPYVTPSAQ